MYENSQTKPIDTCMKSTNSDWTHLLIPISFFLLISRQFGETINFKVSISRTNHGWILIGSLCENKCWNFHHIPTASLSHVLLIRLEILCFSLGLDSTFFSCLYDILVFQTYVHIIASERTTELCDENNAYSISNIKQSNKSVVMPSIPYFIFYTNVMNKC